MTRDEFETLRDMPGKTISANICFQALKDTSPNLTFEGIQVENTGGRDVVLNGTYKPHLHAMTFNFVQRGVGPICRLDVNGTKHGPAGRTHKHDMQQESDQDPKRNLPHAVAREDMDNKSVTDVWKTLCREARIEHLGQFIAPDSEDHHADLR